jgi:chemotaxis protein CheD
MRHDAQLAEEARAAWRGKSVFLQPGEYFVGEGVRVNTLLGSCVSITLWHPRKHIGAMSHFVLASRGGPRRDVRVALDARYGDEALELMVAGLAALGVRESECHAKIFGGGDMFAEASTRLGGGVTVGRRNGRAARAMLEARGIAVRSQHLYGSGHRRIAFDLWTGHVWVRHASEGAPGFIAEGATP